MFEEVRERGYTRVGVTRGILRLIKVVPRLQLGL